MSKIGTFTRNDDGFFGNVRTLTLDVKLAILPAEKLDAGNAPDHRVFCDGLEVGAAWNRTGEKAGTWLSVAIDAPVRGRRGERHLDPALGPAVEARRAGMRHARIAIPWA
jgi:uncharacterized protein (DUF736 family)